MMVSVEFIALVLALLATTFLGAVAHAATIRMRNLYGKDWWRRD